MKILLSTIFYIFGIGLPILVITVAILKKIKNRKTYILNKVLIAVIIFLIFYMLKVGGISLMNKLDDNKEIKTTLVTENKKSTTKNTSSTTKTTTTTSTSTSIVTIHRHLRINCFSNHRIR